jgi:hypothetical protein
VFGPGAWFYVLLALKATLKYSALLNRVVQFNIVLHAFKSTQNCTVPVKEGMNFRLVLHAFKNGFHSKKWATVSKLWTGHSMM